MPFLHLPPLEVEELSPRELSLILALLLARKDPFPSPETEEIARKELGALIAMLWPRPPAKPSAPPPAER